jgi:hypothetical protein
MTITLRQVVRVTFDDTITPRFREHSDVESTQQITRELYTLTEVNGRVDYCVNGMFAPCLENTESVS